MKRWAPGFVATLLSCLWILSYRATTPGLLKDSDTGVLLQTIRQESTWKWFLGDWPLKNHFYRPISTLAFQLDNWLYKDQAWGYGLTNALLVCTCVLLLFWFLRELTESPSVTTISTLYFALLHIEKTGIFAKTSFYLAIVVLVLGAVRHGKSVRNYLPASLVLFMLSGQLYGIGSLYSGTIGWLPGRTATVMTVFALAALAAYARYERLTAKRPEAKPAAALDLPATKGTILSTSKARAPWVWAILSILSLALALGAYEQAVMLPAAFLGVAVSMRLRGLRVHWAWQVAFWAVLVGYIELRFQLLPVGKSAYQSQQLRSSMYGSLIALADYVFPSLALLPGMLVTLEAGPLLWIIDLKPWLAVLQFVSEGTSAYQAKRQYVWCLTGWAMSIIAFLPMAFLKSFDHYHYWPMAMRSLMVTGFILVAKELVVIALSPQSLRAPERLAPAPGSLPRL